MFDYLTLGPAPAGEDCVQVGCYDYQVKAKKECKKYIKLLEKKFKDRPEECSFIIKSNPHDFGSYLEVNVKFNSENEEQTKFAYNVERNQPETWKD